MTTLNPLALQNAPVLRGLKDLPPGGYGSFVAMGDATGRDPSNLRRTLASLAEAGLVSAQPLTDGLTDEGRAQLAAIDRAENSEATRTTPSGFLSLRHDKILPDPKNARRDWTSEDAVADLQALAGSIRERGILQAPNVRPADAYGKHELVGGERRWRAVGLLIEAGDWPADRPIDCKLFDADDIETRLAALDENMQRRNLNPIEEANAYRDLREAGLETADIAARVKMTQRHVQMRLQLLDLTEDQQRRMTLPEGDKDRLSVSEARKLVQNIEARRKAKAGWEEALSPRQRLIMAEVRIRAASDNYWVKVEVDGAAMNADEDAIAVHKAGFLHIPTTVDVDGKAFCRFEYPAEPVTAALFMDGVEAAAASLRDELDLPTPAEGETSIPWLNGPFELTPELQAKIDADKIARAERDEENRLERQNEARARQARTERMSLMRVHAECLLTKAAVAPSAPVIDDLAQIAGGLEHPLPWRATSLAVVLDAMGEQVVRFGNYYNAADDAAVSLAVLTAVAVNTAAGLETPPLERPDAGDEEEPDENAHLAEDDEPDTDDA